MGNTEGNVALKILFKLSRLLASLAYLKHLYYVKSVGIDRMHVRWMAKTENPTMTKWGEYYSIELYLCMCI